MVSVYQLVVVIDTDQSRSSIQGPEYRQSITHKYGTRDD